jgi:hypothetical protein
MFIAGENLPGKCQVYATLDFPDTKGVGWIPTNQLATSGSMDVHLPGAKRIQ